MNKKFVKGLFLFSVIIFCSLLLPLNAQVNSQINGQTQNLQIDSFLEKQKKDSSLFSYQLENGLEIYILEDPENPIIQVSYVAKAGFSVQSQENAGFPELASSLFFKSSSLNQNDIKLLQNLSTELKSDSAIFRATCTLGNLEKAISLFSEASRNPNFTDEVLQSEYISLKLRVQENVNNELAYINSSIDNVLFNEPWKQDTVLYSGINQELMIPEIRRNIQSIYTQFYTPEKSAIFITGAIKADSIYYLIKKYFETWNKSIFVIPETNSSLKNLETKKYVLKSNNFSTDFNQLIIQYPKDGLFSDIKSCGTMQLASLALENSSQFKNAVVNETSGLYDETYIYSGFTENGSASRVILQALMQNNEVSPTLQVENILQNVDKGKIILESEFQEEKTKLLSQENSSRSDIKTLYNALVSSWGYGGTEYFYSYLDYVKTLNLSDVQSVFDFEPYIFLLVNSKTYSTFEEDFKNQGYVLLENVTKFTEEQNQNTEIPEQEIVSSFYTENINTFNFYKLENKIPVIEKQSKNQESFTLHLLINGGELFHSENPGLETITIKYLANNIKKLLEEEDLTFDFTISTETKIYNSSINITCAKDDIELLFKVITQALYFDDLTAGKADELIFAENYNYRLDSASTSSQLFTSGMETIFSGTKLEPLFKTEDSLLSSINFIEIYKSYTELLDANRFSLICLGNIPTNLKSILENTFGSLKALNLVKNNNKIEPIISNLTRTVQIKRIFSTDIKAEDAGPRPLKLIPTTVFTDPVDFYFETPNKQSDEYLYFITLLTEYENFLNHNWENGIKITIHDFKANFDVVRVQFQNVETQYQKTIKNILEKSLEEFILDVKEKAQENLGNYINQYLMKYYNFENTNFETAKLIEKGYVEFNDYLKYLKNYNKIIQAKPENFVKAVENFENLSVLEVRPAN